MVKASVKFYEHNTGMQYFIDMPATASRSDSLKEKYSIAKREASGEAGLWEGGVGRDADGAGYEIRASREAE